MVQFFPSIIELAKRQDSINKASSDFLLFSTDLICCFLIQLFETENPIRLPDKNVFSYNENSDFNESLDDGYGKFMIGDEVFWASEILFQMAPVAYKKALDNYKVSEDETDN